MTELELMTAIARDLAEDLAMAYNDLESEYANNRAGAEYVPPESATAEVLLAESRAFVLKRAEINETARVQS